MREAMTSKERWLAEGRTACADKCLIGGTNAVLWTRCRTTGASP